MTCTAHTVNPYNTPDISPLPQACGTDAADAEGGRGGGGSAQHAEHGSRPGSVKTQRGAAA